MAPRKLDTSANNFKPARAFLGRSVFRGNDKM